MHIDPERPPLTHPRHVSSRVQNVLIRISAWLGAGIVLVSAIAFSIVLFVAAFVGLCAFGGYVLWKTRHVRKQLRTRHTDGNVIEGVVVREIHVRQIPEK
jgi:hypothetical protein